MCPEWVEDIRDLQSIYWLFVSVEQMPVVKSFLIFGFMARPNYVHDENRRSASEAEDG